METERWPIRPYDRDRLVRFLNELALSLTESGEGAPVAWILNPWPL